MKVITTPSDEATEKLGPVDTGDQEWYHIFLAIRGKVKPGSLSYCKLKVARDTTTFSDKIATNVRVCPDCAAIDKIYREMGIYR